MWISPEFPNDVCGQSVLMKWGVDWWWGCVEDASTCLLPHYPTLIFLSSPAPHQYWSLAYQIMLPARSRCWLNGGLCFIIKWYWHVLAIGLILPMHSLGYFWQPRQDKRGCHSISASCSQALHSASLIFTAPPGITWETGDDDVITPDIYSITH